MKKSERNPVLARLAKLQNDTERLAELQTAYLELDLAHEVLKFGHIKQTAELFWRAMVAEGRLDSALRHAPPPRPKRRRQRGKDPQKEMVRRAIREFHAERCSHLEICRRLDALNKIGKDLKPPESWGHSKWEGAYRDPKYNQLCRTFMSKASRRA